MLQISQRKVAQIILYGHEIERGEAELRGFLETLNDEELHSLVAVMWIGRGSFEADDLAEAMATAEREASIPTPDYLLGSPHFCDHLESGMEALGLSVADAEEDLL
ncbi:DUF3775 domain-containing protein [Sulfitobacter mediterraneus]|jgi:hypothetical protein|uniref:Uncharacterized protein DUF3775 n=1 Tax=Sulfitobacter mediterraneus TaxID=83219 RepID=A0A2T6CFP9_9RHOB|nr:DUF3775 domain-containing protein [Sulfitobacter mediterraneus]KIN77699.1 DUF3775 domain containing protein [Sulfitobacter mediterraneus KCTC 32188]PTX74324.1 uncharacterized protein DUF3775 [Sulfitobacter mediterraneus]UWR12169.1 DUF3775 domain-containing protein [Sulfitobacter mediterraneus]